MSVNNRAISKVEKEEIIKQASKDIIKAYAQFAVDVTRKGICCNENDLHLLKTSYDAYADLLITILSEYAHKGYKSKYKFSDDLCTAVRNVVKGVIIKNDVYKDCFSNYEGVVLKSTEILFDMTLNEAKKGVITDE